MKNLCFAILSAGLISTSAIGMPVKSPDMSGYHGGFQVGHDRKSTANFFPATDISVINASDSMLRVSVPGTPVLDWIHTSASPYHVTHSGGSFYTNIVVQDPSYFTIFNQTVCSRALITIYGRDGRYTWNVDEEYCH